MLQESHNDLTLLADCRGYIGGRFVDSSGPVFDVCDPATGSVVATLSSYGAADTEAAVNAAEDALTHPTSLDQRAKWLDAIVAGHAEHREQLARIITLENGKPLSEALGEVDYAQSFYREAAMRVGELAPRTLERTPGNHSWTTHFRPAGVAGIITPWNFPLAMLAKKVSGAIAAGAPMVIKPAEITPLSCIALFRILDGIGMPAGMANLVFGDAPAIGKVMCEHPAVRVISFTGSTGVGKLLSAQAAPFVKRMALELGGNAPFIIFDDANLEHAVEQLMQNKFRSGGQTCVCTNRVYVQSSVAPKVVALVGERLRAIKLGPGIEPDTELGPLINVAGLKKVHELVTDAVKGGATAVVGGVTSGPDVAGTSFYPPTLLENVTADMRCVHEEIFGPVVPIIRFDNEDEVVRAANASEYGLAAYLFSSDADRCARIVAGLQFGHVAVNSGKGPTPEAPFGGMKQSGIGREGGLEGLLEFTEQQTVATPLS
tara:strand:- start:46785 stop:48248 length:1464 start_codon:yes stop_codon:yes gene_type:complete